MDRRKLAFLGVVVGLGCVANLAVGDVVIGDWENSPDGWIDWSGGQNPVGEPKFTYATDIGVTRGSTSLKLTQGSWNQNLSVKLQDVGHREDFFLNRFFSIDVTLPATTASGWSQIYQFVVNAQDYGFVSQGNSPLDNAQWGWGDDGGPAQTHTLTFDYSPLLDGDEGNGEIAATAGWVEFIFATNNDGTHDTFYFDNARLSGAGDANLNGRIDADDYALIDRGLARYQSGSIPPSSAYWTDGDFDNDHAITGADYAIIDAEYVRQGGVLAADVLAAREAAFGEGYVASLMAGVPEPSVGALVVACGWLGRKRVRR